MGKKNWVEPSASAWCMALKSSPLGDSSLSRAADSAFLLLCTQGDSTQKSTAGSDTVKVGPSFSLGERAGRSEAGSGQLLAALSPVPPA